MALPAIHRLRADRDIRTVLREGKTVRGSFFFCKWRSNGRADARIAVIVSGRVARTAVVRNRLRRVITELIRPHLSKLAGYDVTCSIVKNVEFSEQQRHELSNALQRI